MEKFLSLMQFVMSVTMLLLTIIWGVSHIIMETIGLFGILVVLFFALVIYLLVCNSWHEYQQ